ncbi:MAG: DUF721 domain-containing protein [Holosporales bacterium]|jgi:hypothetical protein|nr:DUF721 domain-containing protein [Holosporales bacterium]
MLKTGYEGRIRKPVQICDLVYGICRPAMEKKGMIFSDLYVYWKAIVGSYLSGFTWPEKISKSNDNGLVLYVKAKNTKLVEAQYSSPLLLSKVNEFLGGAKIASIKICRNIDACLNA